MAWLTCARALPGLRLYVETEEGISAELDVHAFIAGLDELRDQFLFDKVSISELGELTWPNGDVIGPDSVAAMLTAGSPYARVLSDRGRA